jgi:hypothetical protein
MLHTGEISALLSDVRTPPLNVRCWTCHPFSKRAPGFPQDIEVVELCHAQS